MHVASPEGLLDDTGRIIGLVGSLRDITERRRIEAQLSYLANNDPLTGLFNRSRFEQEQPLDPRHTGQRLVDASEQ